MTQDQLARALAYVLAQQAIKKAKEKCTTTNQKQK
jgi:hypothetical protein